MLPFPKGTKHHFKEKALIKPLRTIFPIPRIHVSPSQGRLLQVLARAIGAPGAFSRSAPSVDTARSGWRALYPLMAA